MAGRGVAIETRGQGNWVYLRATLPPKPSSTRLRPYQQRIALQLQDLPHNKQRIKAKQRQLDYELSAGLFDWLNWGCAPAPPPSSTQSLAAAIDALEAEMRGARGIAPASFQNNYRELLLRYLPNEHLPSCDELRQALLMHEKASPTRRLLGFACNALSKHLGLNCDLADLRGSYSPKMVEPISLPSDAQIADFYGVLQRVDLRYCYGLLAAYGLRPHEIPHSTVDPETLRCRVSKGKTDSRIVSPLPRSWVEEWELLEPKLPSWANKEDEPRTFTRALYKELNMRNGMEWRPYALRHCYARRCFEHNVGVPIAAKLMGHSQNVHARVYQRWIDEEQVLDQFERITAQRQ